MPVVDTKFELCQDVETVLKIGRDYQNKDGYRGAHYDTVKLLCDTIEYLRDQLPKSDPDWKAICERCHDGEIEPKECEYYGEPNGCNSPIYGERPKAILVNNAAIRKALNVADETANELLSWCANHYQELNCMGSRLKRALESAANEPWRNCDRFGGDYKMLHTAWFDWTGSPSGQNPDGTAKMGFGEWLLELAGKRGRSCLENS